MTGAGGLLAHGPAVAVIVMLLTASSSPRGALRITPPGSTLALAARQLLDGPRRTRASRLAGELTGGAGASTLIVPAGANAGVLLPRAPPVSRRSAFLFVVLVTQMFSPTAPWFGLYREFFELGPGQHVRRARS
jgi:hypothetical protein